MPGPVLCFMDPVVTKTWPLPLKNVQSWEPGTRLWVAIHAYIQGQPSEQMGSRNFGGLKKSPQILQHFFQR